MKKKSSSSNLAKVYPTINEVEDCPKPEKTINADFYELHTKNRKPTDVCCFTVFVTFLTVLCGLIGYCIYHGDIRRVINGYDNCGTICGDNYIKDMKNTNLENCYKTVDEAHFGRYFLTKKGESTLNDRICTNSCKNYAGYEMFLNRCLPSAKKAAIDKIFIHTGLVDFFVEMSEDFHVYWKVFVPLLLISVVISLGFLLLFPFIAKFMVYVVLVGVVWACAGATVYLWMSWNELRTLKSLDAEIKQRQVWTYLGMAVTATCVTVVVVLIIVVMRKRIKLVVQLFQEAGKAVSDMPVLLAEPLLTFLSILCTIALWIYFCMWVSSAGIFTERSTNANKYFYRKDGFMETAKYLNIFGMLWMIQFVIGCQHMVIAGAVSKWYFTRQKSQLSVPITESFYNLTRYHLGTITVGSFLLVVVQILRAILSYAQKMFQNEKLKSVKCLICLCKGCLWILQHILEILSRNAYIITAIYGHSFWKSGKRAFTILSANPLRVTAINSVGDFVLFLSKVLIVACSVTVGCYYLKNQENIQHVWVPLVLVGLFSYFISHCFMSVYEMTIDTIFICFCEDCELNDGISKPYYMSRDLMEFVENSKKAMEVQSKSEKGETNAELQTVSLSVEKGK
ncbi:unnamed protein product [Ceutorhynchus assimilis]|uniref:Choline transporter-like protein n=1 Tax=Ceutorhynchus assimilis TaxID=467358 RepID=A0A9N9QN56_9CUCU|nr:unnamed protein product [Ceutorhynchus assimilis]